MQLSQIRPKLRWPLDVQRFEAQGRSYVALRDEDGVAPDPAIFPAALIPIIARFDGSRSLDEILQEGAPYGLTEELLRRLVQELEALFFLETEETRKRWQSLQDDYFASPIRPAAHAGRVYPADPEELRARLDGFIEQTRSRHQIRSGSIVSVISPHIDYQRGWEAYGSAYAALAEVPRPDLIVLIGTSHQPSELTFHLTTKSYATPFGVAHTEQQLVEQIAGRYGRERCLKDEILHRREHSLELQLPFLMRRYSNGEMPPVVPILVGSFHRYFFEERSPLDDAEVSDFVDSLAEVLKTFTDSGKKVLFYAGVDLAHVGVHFGDMERVSDTGLEQLESRDRALLRAVLAADEHSLFEHMAEDCDRRRICGYPSLYTMFAAMRRANWSLEGELLDYRQAVDPALDCVVTFASAYYHRS